jgi:hypothetical protein
MIVRFDATIDDVVDVAVRSWANSKTMRLWRWQGAAVTGLMLGLPAYFLVPATVRTRLIIGAAVTLLGAAYHLVTYEENFRKRTRKLWKEKFGSDAPFTVTVELLDEGLSFSQTGSRNVLEWARVDRVEETIDALYFFSRDNVCSAVRKRGFETVAMKDEFLNRAQAYIQQFRGT